MLAEVETALEGRIGSHHQVATEHGLVAIVFHFLVVQAIVPVTVPVTPVS